MQFGVGDQIGRLQVRIIDYHHSAIAEQFGQHTAPSCGQQAILPERTKWNEDATIMVLILVDAVRQQHSKTLEVGRQ